MENLELDFLIRAAQLGSSAAINAINAIASRLGLVIVDELKVRLPASTPEPSRPSKRGKPSR